MKTLLVTGGCGFIGSHFIKGFLNSHPDWKIINLDKLTYCGNPENTKSLEGNSRYEFVQGDICEPKAVDHAMEKSEAIVHFAAETHVDRSISDSNDFLLTNVMGTRVLLDAAKKFQIKRFVHVSTDEVYGSVEKGAAAEDASLAPNSPYSASKAASDLLVRSYWKTYQLPVLITRSTNNFGSNQFPEKIIPLFITNLLEGKKVPVYAKGENRRDWIYVEDNCRAIERVFDRGEAGEIYNISGGNEMSNMELTRFILKSSRADESRIQFVEDRPGHDFRYSVDDRKIKTLGFRPARQFQEALEQTIRWYAGNESWWKPLKKDKFTLK